MNINIWLFTAIIVVFITIGAADAADMGNWRLQLHEGAEGMYQPNTGTLSKSNGVGKVELLWRRTFPVKSGANYILKLPYHTDNASLENLLLLRYTYDDSEKPTLDTVNDGFSMYTGQSLMRNSPPGQWDTRYCTVHTTRDGNIIVRAILYGNPCNLRVAEPTMEDYKTTPPLIKEYMDLYSDEEVKRQLDKRLSGTACIKQFNGRPALFINKKPVPSMLYKGVNATKNYGDYTAFAEQRINLAAVAIATGDTTGYNQCDTEPVWLGHNRFALERIDAALLRALRRNINAQLILDIRINPYKAWGTEHPTEIIRNAKGERAYAPTDYVGKFTSDTSLVDPPASGKWWYPSWQSEVWSADLERVYARIAEHVKSSPYGKAVVGFFITGNDDGQFVVHYNDHSEPAQRAFRTWLMTKYGSLARLNSVWKTDFSNIIEITVPEQEWPDDITHYAPGPQPDFRIFRERNPWEVRELLAKALKKNIGKQVVVMTYAAPYCSAFVDCADLDAVGMQPDYAHRRNGFPLSFNPICADDVGNRLLFTELDLRSNTGEAWPVSDVFREWVSAPKTAEEWHRIHRKAAGLSIANGFADWYYDMGQYFNNPDVHTEIGSVQRIRQQLQNTKRSVFRPDVCVISTENDRAYLAHDEAVIPYDEVNFNPQGLALASSGVPFERHYLKDVIKRSDLQNFKVYIFLQNAFIGEDERRFIKDKLQNRKRTIVWVYNSGYISEAGKSIDAMSDLIGIRLACDEKLAHRTMIMDNRALKPFCGGAEMYFTIFNGRMPGVQTFRVVDSAASPIAHYAETGEIASATKEFKMWTSIYIGAAQGLSNDMMNYIARGAGAYIAGAPGDMINLNGEFASIHAMHTGDCTLTLPSGRRQLIDADTGKILLKDGRQYTFPVQAQQTYWFLFK